MTQQWPPEPWPPQPWHHTLFMGFRVREGVACAAASPRKDWQYEARKKGQEKDGEWRYVQPHQQHDEMSMKCRAEGAEDNLARSSQVGRGGWPPFTGAEVFSETLGGGLGLCAECFALFSTSTTTLCIFGPCVRPMSHSPTEPPDAALTPVSVSLCPQCAQQCAHWRDPLDCCGRSSK
uniref:Uncharacterized protein n=1 Tax=Eutreptiella gymnastica TaxID=73025 RepID=A0A7S4G831_9EUGL